MLPTAKLLHHGTYGLKLVLVYQIGRYMFKRVWLLSNLHDLPS